MAKLKHFKELKAWQEARVLTQNIYEICRYPKFRRDFGLKDQIQRAVISIMANISEGFDSGTQAHFLQFLGYANRSASEVESLLYIALDQNYITHMDFEKLCKQIDVVKSLIRGLMRYLRSNP